VRKKKRLKLSIGRYIIYLVSCCFFDKGCGSIIFFNASASGEGLVIIDCILLAIEGYNSLTLLCLSTTFIASKAYLVFVESISKCPTYITSS